MQQNKPKITIQEDSIGMSRYEFDKKLLELNRKELFTCDDNGKIIGLNYEEYLVAAVNLLNKIERRI